MESRHSYPLDLKGNEDMLDDNVSSSASSEEGDCIEVRSEDSASEQDISSEAECEFDFDDDFYLGRNRETKWSIHEPPRTNVKTRSKNIVSHLPGPINAGRLAKTVLDCWALFFNDDMLHCIIENTNKFILKKQQSGLDVYRSKFTDLPEIKAFLGILYLTGVHKANRLNTADIWNGDGTGIELIRAVMPETRFKFLLRHIHFDDENTRQERMQTDKLSPIREIFDNFANNCQTNYSISQYATIDEMLLGFRGRCSFRQYIPSKPSKYGLKMYALVDSRMFYTSYLEVYLGNQPEGPYKVNNSPSSVVERMCQYIKGSNRNITMDNWFNSYSLACNLLRSKLTIVGTLRKNKKEIPSQFLNPKRKIHSSLFGFQKSCTLLSYVPRKRKHVILLSTFHHDAAVDTTTEKSLPEIIKFYNLTKGGVDVVDQMCASYNCSRNSRRWPMTLFYALLNIAGINAQVIYFANGNPSGISSRREFLKMLALKLMNEHLGERIESKYLSKELRLSAKRYHQTIEEISAKEMLVQPSKASSSQRKQREQTPPSSEDQPEKLLKRKRCEECGRKKNRFTKYRCTLCNKYLCLEHCVPLCLECFENKFRKREKI